MSSRPSMPAKEIVGGSANFTDFARRLMQVPHSEIKAKLDAEREAKRTPKRASPVSAAPSKAR